MQNVTKEKFSGRANVYDKYRPGYPEVLYDFIIDCAGLCKNGTIADIGAGTGKFSENFLKKGYKVFGIEPNAEMKAVMDKNFVNFDGYIGINATAENTALPSGSVDCITAAQAFHWFDGKVFKKECQRILKNEGKVFLIWNMRDENAPVVKELFAVNKRYCPEFKGFSGGINIKEEKLFIEFFKDESYEVQSFENEISYDSLTSFVGRILSNSYALKDGQEEFSEYVKELQTIYQKYNENGRLTIKQNAVVFWGTV